MGHWALIWGIGHYYMLRLKHDSKRSYDIETTRKHYQQYIRKQELQLMFQTIRRTLLQQERMPEPCPPPMPTIVPVPVPQPYIDYNLQYIQYLNYVLRAPAPPLPLLPPSPSPPPVFAQEMAVQIRHEPRIYLQKNGVVVYKSMLGRGSYSRVWEGKMVGSGERVAVKEVQTLQPSEQQCLRQLHSQNIVKVIEIFQHAAKSFIVLELCDGNLREQLVAIDYELQAVLGYFQQLVTGLGALQARAIVHRDLKFENLLVRAGTLKIADFGLAKFLGDELQVESRRCGTPYTMAPQVFFAQGRPAYSVKSDLWAVGVILHEMLYRQHPFGCSTRQMQQKKRVSLVPKFGVLDKIINRCLVFDPDRRTDWREFMQLFLSYKQSQQGFGGNLPKWGQMEVEVELQVPKLEERPFAKRNIRFYQEPDHHQPQVVERDMNLWQKRQKIAEIPSHHSPNTKAIHKERPRERQLYPLPPQRRRFQFQNNEYDTKREEKGTAMYVLPPQTRLGKNHIRQLQIQNKVIFDSPARPIILTPRSKPNQTTQIATFVTIMLLVTIMAFL